jgi:hypothetical protein
VCAVEKGVKYNGKNVPGSISLPVGSWEACALLCHRQHPPAYSAPSFIPFNFSHSFHSSREDACLGWVMGQAKKCRLKTLVTGHEAHEGYLAAGQKVCGEIGEPLAIEEG